MKILVILLLAIHLESFMITNPACVTCDILFRKTISARMAILLVSTLTFTFTNVFGLEAIL